MLLPFDEFAASGTAEGPLGIDAGEAGRGLFDDVNDYIAHTDVGARSINNPAAVIPGLDQYTVSVVVQNDGNLGAGALAVPNASAELVTVRVTHPDGVNVVLVTTREQPFDTAFTRTLGLDPRQMRYLGVKSAAHFRAGFESWAGQIHVVSEPSVHSAEIFSFKNLGRELYPLNRSICS